MSIDITFAYDKRMYVGETATDTDHAVQRIASQVRRTLTKNPDLNYIEVSFEVADRNEEEE